MILNQIIQSRKRDLAEIKSRLPMRRLKDAVLKGGRKTEPRNFKKALKNSHEFNLICEVKKASPSGGVLREDFQPLKIAAQYEDGGAAALSVLTEPHFFKGRSSYLRTIRQVVKLPILRKDFIFETYQIYETALLEADAFLLIASILTEEELVTLIDLGRELGMQALVEIHTHEDLKKALAAKADIIGINNRNLKTLEVDTNFAKQIIPHIPHDKTIVVESGIQTHSDLLGYKSLGIQAFLVGTSLMRSPNIMNALFELLGRDSKYKKGGSLDSTS